MTITDNEVKKELKRVRCCTLEEMVDTYPDDERDGRSDIQILADECSYMLSCFSEDGHVFCDDIKWAKEVLRETKNGKVIPLWKESLTPVYTKSDIANARYSINEYKRLQNLMKRLNAKGIYGRW